MKADKPLEWNPPSWAPDQLRAKTEFHGFMDCYQIVPPIHPDETGWWVSGVGNQFRVDDIDEGKRICQDDYNRRRRLKAWEDYMLSHDPPEES